MVEICPLDIWIMSELRTYTDRVPIARISHMKQASLEKSVIKKKMKLGKDKSNFYPSQAICLMFVKQVAQVLMWP